MGGHKQESGNRHAASNPNSRAPGQGAIGQGDGARVALITGAARRLGAAIAQHLHQRGYDVVLHYRESKAQTQALADSLNALRPGSARLLQARLGPTLDYQALVAEVLASAGRLDLLVNNASEFFPTPVGQMDALAFQRLFDSNVAGPLFLSQAAAEPLRQTGGSIVNLVDIHADRPLKNYPVYSMAKAANAMMVKALAKELAPQVRVNGVAPGCILWPEGEEATASAGETRKQILDRIALGRTGSPQDIAETVYFLANAPYITGQILAVDGGRSLNM